MIVHGHSILKIMVVKADLRNMRKYGRVATVSKRETMVRRIDTRAKIMMTNKNKF